MIERLVVYGYCFYYSFLFSLYLIYHTIKNPFWWKPKERNIPPKCLNQPELGTHNYVQLSQIKIHYVEAGDKSKPLMLFLHGFPEFWYSWRHQIKEFSSNYWCVAIDMRGYGDSEKPEGILPYRMFNLVEDIKEVVDKLGRKKFILVAHDWGGVIAWDFLQRYHSMVDRYVIMNAPSSAAWAKLQKIDKDQFKKSWYILFFQMRLLPELYMQMDDLKIFETMFGKKLTTEDIEAYKYTFGKPGALQPPVNYYRNLFENIKTRTLPSKWDSPPPGLLIFGEKDVALSIKFVDVLAEMYENLSTKIIKNANHFVQQDAWEEVNKEMKSFLNK